MGSTRYITSMGELTRKDNSLCFRKEGKNVYIPVENTKEIQKVTMIDKVVDMTKNNIAGDEVEGAKMQVFDKEGNIVDEWESGKEPHIINNLKENETYTLHEEITPNGYVKATDVEFTYPFGVISSVWFLS